MHYVALLRTCVGINVYLIFVRAEYRYSRLARVFIFVYNSHGNLPWMVCWKWGLQDLEDRIKLIPEHNEDSVSLCINHVTSNTLRKWTFFVQFHSVLQHLFKEIYKKYIQNQKIVSQNVCPAFYCRFETAQCYFFFVL